MKDIRFAKFVLLVNGLVPGTILLWDVVQDRAGADPVKYAIWTTGLLALIFLTLTLLVTPLRKITGLRWLFHFRRRLGLFAFFYALAHFSIFFIFDRALSLSDTLAEMVKRPYLIVGSTGLMAMMPLALTSTNAMIRRMGPKRWHALHRLVYVAAIAGVVHFYMQVKADTRWPIIFGIAIGVLLGYRVVASLVKRVKEPAQPTETSETSLGTQYWKGTLRIERITQETPEVRTFRLVPSENSELPFIHSPGQHLMLSLMINNKKVKRTYTIASPPTKRNYCEITVKRETQGLASQHLHHVVKEGDTWQVAAPAGRFVFTGAEADRVALLAGGVGITPLMSILRSLTDQHWNGQIYLIFSCKTEQDIIFREELETLQCRFPNLHLTLTLTRDQGTDWKGHTGRINAQLLTKSIPNVTEIPFYLCGPTSMLKDTQDLLQQLGVASDNIHTESFGLRSASTSTPLAKGSDYIVTFAQSNKTGKINSDRPILELAEELDVGVDSECRSGICGRCKCQMVSGSVQMETQEALDSDDHQNNMILLCQARALDNVTVNA